MEVKNVTRLAVDFAEKDVVKALGAKWNPQERFWFVPVDHINPDLFAKWFRKDRIEKKHGSTQQPELPFGGIPIEGMKLAVSFDEKDSVKELGARWNPQEKFWYIPVGHSNPKVIAKWAIKSSPDKTGNGQKRHRDEFQGSDCGGYLQMAMDYGRDSTIKEMRKLNCPRGYCLDFWKYGTCIFQQAKHESVRCPYVHRLP